MTEKEIQASINQHLRKTRMLEIQLETVGRLAAHSEARLHTLQSEIHNLTSRLESERDFLYMLESGDIQSYQECQF